MDVLVIVKAILFLLILICYFWLSYRQIKKIAIALNEYRQAIKPFLLLLLIHLGFVVAYYSILNLIEHTPPLEVVQYYIYSFNVMNLLFFTRYYLVHKTRMNDPSKSVEKYMRDLKISMAFIIIVSVSISLSLILNGMAVMPSTIIPPIGGGIVAFVLMIRFIFNTRKIKQK